MSENEIFDSHTSCSSKLGLILELIGKEIYNSNGNRVTPTSGKNDATISTCSSNVNPPTKKSRKDFFGRPIPTFDAECHKSKLEPTLQININYNWFKYHEGYSNAVRRGISVADFITMFY